MNTFPEIPRWQAVHPMIVHFPIALLLVTAVFLVLGLCWHRVRFALWGGALLLMILGSTAAILAVASGEASAGAVTVSKEIEEVIEAHEEAGELTRTAFIVLTVIFAGLWGIYRYQERLFRQPLTNKQILIAMSVFVAIYVASCSLLVYTGSLGGKLVHEFGVKAPLSSHQSLVSKDAKLSQ